MLYKFIKKACKNEIVSEVYDDQDDTMKCVGNVKKMLDSSTLLEALYVLSTIFIFN